jgi:hypothetical protein
LAAERRTHSFQSEIFFAKPRASNLNLGLSVVDHSNSGLGD